MIAEVYGAAVRNFVDEPSAQHRSELVVAVRNYDKAIVDQYRSLENIYGVLDNPRELLLLYRSNPQQMHVRTANSLAQWFNKQLQLTGAKPEYYRKIQDAIDFFIGSEHSLSALGEHRDNIKEVLHRLSFAGRQLRSLGDRLQSSPGNSDVADVRHIAVKVHEMLTAKEGIFPRK